MGEMILLGIAVVGLGTVPRAAAAGEGFGVFKKAAKVTRVSPPAVFLPGNRLVVKVSASSGVDAAMAQRLQAQLESQLLSREPRFAIDAKQPEAVVEVNVLQNRGAERWEKRHETQTRKSGTDAKGRDKYESYQVEVNYKVVTHSIRGAYKVTSAQGRSLDADSLVGDYEKAFREGEQAPDAAQVETAAVDAVVDHIARRLTPSREQIEVLLPRASLDGLGALAEAGLWNRYLEALEKRPAGKGSDESYRQYAIGTAYEALGYAADDAETTLKYLEKADSCFSSALDANPQEKSFSQPYKSVWSGHVMAPPLERVQSALVSYRRLKDFKDAQAAAQQKTSGESAGSKDLGAGAIAASEKPAAGAAERMDNAAVIRMVRAGLGQDIVLKAIDAAPSREFDVSASGLIALSEAKVGAPIISHIQRVAGGPKSSRRPAARPATASPTKGVPPP